MKKRRAVANNAEDDGDQTAVDGVVAPGVMNDRVGDGDVDMTGWEEFYDYVFPDDEKSG